MPRSLAPVGLPGLAIAADAATPAGAYGGQTIYSSIEQDALVWDGSAWRQPRRGWELVADKDGSSLTGFTSRSETWSSNGTEIVVTTGGSAGALELTALDVRSPHVIKADVKIVTAGGAGKSVGLWLAYPGGASVSGFNRAQLRNDDTVSVTTDGTGERSSAAFTVAADTWYTMTAVCLTPELIAVLVGSSVYLENVNCPASGGPAKRIALWSDCSEARFRNLKVYRSRALLYP